MQLFVKLSPKCNQVTGLDHECLDSQACLFQSGRRHCKTPVARAGGSNFIHTQLCKPIMPGRPQSQLCSRVRSLVQRGTGRDAYIPHKQPQSEERWRGGGGGMWGDLMQVCRSRIWGRSFYPLFLLLLAQPWTADGHFGTAEFRAHTARTPHPPRSTYLVVDQDITYHYYSLLVQPIVKQAKQPTCPSQPWTTL